MHPFLVALQFLTRLPVAVASAPAAQLQGRSLPWYPLVGLLLGLLLLLAQWWLQGESALLVAAVMLALWVGLTGALHLDGLADSADAWVGGMGERERTLAIMKDPASGPMGVSALLVVLLLKFAALEQIVAAGESAVVLLVPALARAGAALLFVTTPYVRSGGLGAALSQQAPRRRVFAAAALSLLASLLLPGAGGIAVALVVALLWLLLRHMALQRLGGFTGDVAGAVVELLECAALLAFVVFAPNI